MPDPQVPANAVQEAQDVLQNPAPDEAQAPAVQAQAPAQADEVSLEVCETLFSLSFVSCFVLVLECFVSVSVLRFCLFLSALFYFYRFAGLPCFEHFALFICGPALRAIFKIHMLFALLLTF